MEVRRDCSHFKLCICSFGLKIRSITDVTLSITKLCPRTARKGSDSKKGRTKMTSQSEKGFRLWLGTMLPSSGARRKLRVESLLTHELLQWPSFPSDSLPGFLHTSRHRPNFINDSFWGDIFCPLAMGLSAKQWIWT